MNRIRPQSKKRAKKQRLLDDQKANLIEEVGERCEECGTNGSRLTVSHRIPISRLIDFIHDRNNLDLLCMECHRKVEAGEWWDMKKGIEIAEYVALNCEELFFEKMYTARLRAVFGKDYLLTEEQIFERSERLNPLFIKIGWEPFSLEQYLLTNQIEKQDNKYKILY